MAQEIVEVIHRSQVTTARTIARETAAVIGFDETVTDEIGLAVTELATNLVRHAGGGRLMLTSLRDGERLGIQIESDDSGPGIPDVERAIGDGYSTSGGPGYGLGAVNRLMDELDFVSRSNGQPGTHIMCRRWMREPIEGISPFAFGVATRPHPLMQANGDSFVVKEFGESALVAVIDGLGHGQFAHRAAETARRYIESHVDQPLLSMFNGVARACRVTRGVVMAVARFDWAPRGRLTFASIGNIEARVFQSSEPMNLAVRRGVVGSGIPNPVVTEHSWNVNNILIMHSDGLRTRWTSEDIDLCASPTQIAHQLLRKQARDDDDATVVVTKARQTLSNEG